MIPLPEKPTFPPIVEVRERFPFGTLAIGFLIGLGVVVAGLFAVSCESEARARRSLNRLEVLDQEDRMPDRSNRYRQAAEFKIDQAIDNPRYRKDVTVPAGGSVAPLNPSNRNTLGDGAFVEVSIWISAEDIARAESIQ